MPFVKTYWIFFCVAIHVTSSQTNKDKVKYDGSQVWQVHLRGAEDMQYIQKLIDSQDVSIWSLTQTRADFLVRDQNKMKVYRRLVSRNLNHTVLILDVQRRIEINTRQVVPALWTENTLRVGHRLSWKKFPTLDIIEEFYNFLAEDYSSICKVQTIGYTAENRTIKMINITDGNPKNKIILITGGSHAREWVSVTSALYILNNIVTKFDTQSNYIKNKNWLIIPVMNPDGYAYTHTVDRLWRKNRRNFTRCNGVDINRNFDSDWGIVGITQSDECKVTYSGPYAFSERETKALRKLIGSLNWKPVALLDLHSYGNLILFPWSARTQATEDFDKHLEVAELMRSAIFKSSKENYTYGATYHKIYPATGTFLDWAYSEGVVHSYVIEIKDKGKLGFLIPPKEIEDTGKELFAAVRALAKYLNTHKRKTESDTEKKWF
ncbi:hypothetical protein PYW07_005249 [Mythimna separata]|uniref:Peptidase M14 domain-containing protein n=1 Tax=Mythimna separata TaxID=271217 RepID=A0AAD7YEZ5_MYTSE|nr:hypothetical protein PYW07_005249 [Mythimna separata]